ncbi:MAG: hypothetical protein ACT4QG_23045 [Sporichthyaceae bacterium]
MIKSSGSVRVGIVAILSAGGLLVGAAGAIAAVPTTADSRALPQEGKATDCKSERVKGEAFGLGIDGAKDPAGKIKSARGAVGKDAALDITEQASGGFITAVIVQNAAGYNVYRVGFTANTSLTKAPYKDLVGPTAEGQKKPGVITGWAACVAEKETDIGDTPDGAEDAPPVGNSTTITPREVCNAYPPPLNVFTPCV